jgi:hypothetical protein
MSGTDGGDGNYWETKSGRLRPGLTDQGMAAAAERLLSLAA